MSRKPEIYACQVPRFQGVEASQCKTVPPTFLLRPTPTSERNISAPRTPRAPRPGKQADDGSVLWSGNVYECHGWAQLLHSTESTSAGLHY